MNQSQNAKILSWLQRGRTLTALQAFRLCGTLALHSRASELRSRGHKISCEIVRVGNRVIGRYSLKGRA